MTRVLAATSRGRFLISLLVLVGIDVRDCLYTVVTPLSCSTCLCSFNAWPGLLLVSYVAVANSIYRDVGLGIHDASSELG